MAMVQASENVIKEAQAPVNPPYNSMTGEENPDFDFRVVKETQVISLDPAVKPFIPQSMSGYTGNANTPPSVLNKMFNTGVLGQTPAFVRKWRHWRKPHRFSECHTKRIRSWRFSRRHAFRPSERKLY